ncbi:DUF6034 family protein [Frisingicoccus sp.]|uniref:DUF6034 family protein n=1 Tax=Frisingicoccus sp. TaxID=1918627 RepID=UPI003AB6B374
MKICAIRYTRIAVCTVIASLLLSGCQKNPDSSMVVNKDMDNLIEEAQKDGEGTVDMANIAGAYETYQTTLSDDSLGVSVNVNAKVDIPQAEQMSVFRVQQKRISQEFLDKVLAELTAGETLYDAGVTLSMRTRSDIEEELRGAKAEMERLKNSDEPDKDIFIEDNQRYIDELQEAYENAPEQPVWEGNESDGLLHPTAEMTGKAGGEDFYEWEYSLNQNGEIFYAANNGANDNYISITAQNNDERGNKLSFRRGRHGYDFTAVAIVETTVLDEIASGVWPADEDRSKDYAERMLGGEMSFVEYTDEPTTISEEEARTKADDLMQKLGLSDTYQWYEGGLYSEIPDIRKGGDWEPGYRKLYIFRYMRSMDGVFTTFDPTGKHEEGWNGDDYVKKDWPLENIEIRVNDSGIVGFDYNAPLEVTETVVENSNMKSFDEVRGTFEQMVTVANAKVDSDLDSDVVIEIDRVVLGYARISEADSYDTGLMVPVWDFQGKKTDEYGTEYKGGIMTINAIDGSVIDRSLGY